MNYNGLAFSDFLHSRPHSFVRFVTDACLPLYPVTMPGFGMYPLLALVTLLFIHVGSGSVEAAKLHMAEPSQWCSFEVVK
jgi:hypothetical protein